MPDNNGYFFETDEEVNERRYFVVICYDISDNKRRTKFSKFLERYAIRVQKSVFEGELSKSNYQSLVSKIKDYIIDEDMIRVYRISGSGEIKVWGRDDAPKAEEVIII